MTNALERIEGLLLSLRDQFDRQHTQQACEVLELRTELALVQGELRRLRADLLDVSRRAPAVDRPAPRGA
jgi:hypothetical protein